MEIRRRDAAFHPGLCAADDASACRGGTSGRGSARRHLYAIARRLAGGFTRGATELAATVQPGGFATGSAYFTGKPEEKKESAPEAPRTTELEEIEREIADRRGDRK
jgi:hypothetical protein